MGALVVIAERIPRRVKGMLLGLVAAASFTLLHTTVRYASRELHVFEITFFRYFIALVFMLPGLVTSRFEVLRTRRLHLHLIRCVMLMISMLGLFSALTMSPIAIGHGAELRLAGLRIGGRHPVPARALHGQPLVRRGRRHRGHAADRAPRSHPALSIEFPQSTTTADAVVRCADTWQISGAMHGHKAIGRDGAAALARGSDAAGGQDACAGRACGGCGAADRVYTEGVA